jgi:hypothetical protein
MAFSNEEENSPPIYECIILGGHKLVFADKNDKRC